MSRTLLILATFALAIPGLAGCIQAPADPSNVDDAIMAKLSQVLYPNVIAEHVPIPSFDGTIIDAWVFRPDTSETGEQVPIIINFSPYWGNLAPAASTGGDAFSLYLIDYFVPRGYAAALVSARGTGLSEGCFTIGGPLELQDENAVVDHLATLPWSNGAVTASGKSYDGTMANGLLTMDNPHVKTIVPVSGITELYKYNYFHGVPYGGTGGVFNARYVGTVSAAQQTDPTDPTWGETPTRFCDESAGVAAEGVGSHATGDYTPYWQARNYTALLPDKIDASVFIIHGLQDWNVKPDHLVPFVYELYARDVTVKMMLGQWAHDYPTRGDWNMTMLRWFDHYLKGIDTGILDEPLIEVEDNEGMWRHEADWPPTRAAAKVLYTDGSGTLGEEAGSGMSRYNDDPATSILPGMVGGRNIFETTFEEGGRIVGEPLFHAVVSSTGPRATLSVSLAVDGKVVDQGLLDLYHRDDLKTGTPMMPNTQYSVLVRFFPQDIVIPAGSKVTLQFGHSTPGPAGALANPTGSVVTVHHGAGTFVELPFLALDDVTLEVEQPEDVGCWAC